MSLQDLGETEVPDLVKQPSTLVFLINDCEKYIKMSYFPRFLSLRQPVKMVVYLFVYLLVCLFGWLVG